jgi:hypothetical protein
MCQYGLDILKNKIELKACVDMYFKWPTNFPIDHATCVRNFEEAWRRKKFIRVLRENNKIVSWIYATPTKLLHSKETFMYQHYYCSDLVGYSAALSVVLLHNELLKEAERLGIAYCMSGGRFDDLNFTMTKILEKAGWSRKGSLAVVQTNILKRPTPWFTRITKDCAQ